MANSENGIQPDQWSSKDAMVASVGLGSIIEDSAKCIQFHALDYSVRLAQQAIVRCAKLEYVGNLFIQIRSLK